MSLDIDSRGEVLHLLDTYGGLLTDHQREATRLHLAEDWSYAEIAASQGVSRAAVYDMVHRAQVALAAYEVKLGLVAAESRRQVERAGVRARLDELEGEVRSLRKAVKGLT
ncbi:MAG: RNA polymerase subunit sigma-70 [Candidatus Dormibacteraeota bacterium]|nr:RNA polymerase subunit sigma-70 [Candidatus Dormibacteraeota bacterium]